MVVGPHSALAKDRVKLRGLNWLAAAPVPQEGARLQAKLRSAADPAAATVRIEGTCGFIDFDVPQMAVAPGQAAVFYEESRVLGGGWIVSADNRLAAA